jgi:class 3 adenylate cyclase/tetratricopeptide (TPR) repeat protein
VNCPACGTLNEAGRKFCGECGTSLSVACPSCGTANVPGVKFCGECGTGLTDAPAMAAGISPAQPEVPSAAVPAGSERRLVSVLFADLVGSTTLAEDRDPEESRELLTRFFDTTSDLIGRYGGTVEKFIGDAVMAVWGVPVAHEDDAERAVRAALDLVSAVGGLTDVASGQALQLRAAVLTGEAAATIGAQGQGMVAGDLVNTASRLQSVAPPGSVLVGEGTYRATSGAIGYEEAGEQALKGRTAPVAAWRATHVLGLRGGAGRRTALEPPFVGRDEELRLVKDLFHATLREHKPRLVTIVGQGGIGKSRLGWEFEKYIDGVTIDTYWHSGRSPSYGEGISFWALAEMVRERAGIAESDSVDDARGKLAACAREWLIDAEERRWVEPRLAGLLGLDDMPAGERAELFAAWRTFFQRIAERDPVILVFKDLHWADGGLLEFIEDLLTWSKTHPIYVLAMTRPDLFERHPTWGSGVRSATTISLEPLDDDAMRSLLGGLVPGLPTDAVAAIVARAEGVPLYAVETVRMLLDRGQLKPEGDGYALDGPIDRLGVPESLHALVAARIDANPPEDRSLLADGAVLGQSFTAAAVAGIGGRALDAVEPGLDRLVQRELLIRDDDPRSPERGQYRFVQAVVREIAYETLAKTDRRAKHLGAARYFEALGDDELTGVLASHYVEALHATPAGPEADALAAQARIALRAAADRANALHAWSVAKQHLVDALNITTEPAERAALTLAVAEVGNNLSSADSEGFAKEAITLATELGDDSLRNRAVGLAGEIYVNRSQGADALAILEPAASTLSDADPDAGRIFSQLARLYMMTDRFDESIVETERALRAAARARDTEIVVQALVTRASSLASVDRYDEAIALFRGAIELADRDGHFGAGLRARNNLVSVLRTSVPLRGVLELIGEALEIARRYGVAGWLAQHLTTHASIAIALGDWDVASRDLDELAELPLGEFHHSALPGLRSQLQALRGDLEAAAQSMADAIRRLGTIDTAPQVTGVALAIGSTQFLLGDFAASMTTVSGVRGGGNDIYLIGETARSAAALGLAGPIAEVRTESGTLPVSDTQQAWIHYLNAAAASVAGRWDEARAEYAASLAGFRVTEENLEAALVRLEQDAYLGARFEDARAGGQQAEAWFAERGAPGVPERYRAAFKGTPAPPATGSAAPPRSPISVDAEQRA